MKFLHFDTKRIAWLLVPKTASTSVKTAFLEWLDIPHVRYGDGQDQAGDGERSPGPHEAALPYKTEGQAVQLYIDGGWLFLGFVRHPLARIVSAFHDHITVERLAPLGFRPSYDSFDAAIDLICRTPDDELDHHFGPQCQHLQREHGAIWLPDCLWKFEELPGAWDHVQNIFDSREPSAPLPDLRHERPTRHRPWQSYYSPEQLERLGQRFSAEFETLAEHGIHYTVSGE